LFFSEKQYVLQDFLQSTKYIVFRVLQLIEVKSRSIAESRIREAASILV